jgi:hypothetical protein
MPQEIQPEKVRTPIQLLAAWLVGLILIDGSFLASASVLKTPWWAPGALVIAAVFNVPLFLRCIFLLQTKYRPETMQDSDYAKYLGQQQEGKKLARIKETVTLMETVAGSLPEKDRAAVQAQMAALRESVGIGPRPG